MEIDILEESKNKIIFKVKGETHTLANLLEKELWNDKDVKAAGYHVEHPLIGIPRIVVETNTGASARDAVEKAAKRLSKQFADFSKAFSKAK